MTESEYRMSLKKWINHKLLLSKSSHWYKIPVRAKAIKQIHNAFNDFLLNDKLFTVQKIAARMLYNEDLLNIVLPIPGNPSYENSFRVLSDLLNFSKSVI